MAKNQHQEVERPLPHSKEAERSVLGAILQDHHALDVATERLRPNDFFHDYHKKIFQTMIHMDRNEEKIDLVTITEELTRSGNMEAAGGAVYLSQLTDGMPRVSNVDHYAKIVKEHSVARRVIFLGHMAQQGGFDTGEIDKVLSDLEHNIAEIRDDQSKDTAPTPIAKVVDDAMPQVEKIYASASGMMLGVSTGFPKLDAVIAGWVPREYVLLAARPSQGKTALGLRYAAHLCKMSMANIAIDEPPLPVAIFSLEQDKLSLLLRLACMEGEVDGHQMRTGALGKEDWARLTNAIGVIRTWPLWISDPATMTSGELVSRIRALSDKRKLRLAIVDYLQLVSYPGKENRQQEIAAVSKDIRRAANMMGKLSGGTMLAMSQLSRLAARNGRPTLEDIRESGAIEQDADTIMFLYADRSKKGRAGEDQQVGQTEPMVKWLEVAKQRNGPTRRMKQLYLPQWLRFEEYTDDVFGDEPEPEPSRRSRRKKSERDGD